MSHEQARTALLLTIGAVTPFVLRYAGDWIVSLLIEKCCKMKKKELAIQLIGKGESQATMNQAMQQRMTWEDARKDLGINFCTAFTVSMVRLLFWHWMQPFLYFWVVYAYWDLLDKGQQVLALIVAGREVIYFVLTLIGLCVNRVYLLVDLRASWKEEKLNLGLYVLAPEKYVYSTVVKSEGSVIICWQLGMYFLTAIDLAGVVAFIWAFAVDNVYAPIMVGYGVTTIGGIFVICAGCVACIAGKFSGLK